MLSDAKRSRLLKLLNLTSSLEDHEALSALKRVRELLKGESLSWEQLLGGPAQAAPRRPAPKPSGSGFKPADFRTPPFRGEYAQEFYTFYEEEIQNRNYQSEFQHKKPQDAPPTGKFWVVDHHRISVLFDQLLNTGLVFGASEYKFITESFAIWKASSRLTDLQFSALAALLEREMRQGRKVY